MAEADNLTGVWEGLYNWPGRRPPTPFTAVLIDTGGSLSGSVHEIALGGQFEGRELTAMLAGARSGRSVAFTKTYEAKPVSFLPVSYEGTLNAEATEIEGAWTIRRGPGGRFLMMRARRPAETVDAKTEVAVPVE